MLLSGALAVLSVLHYPALVLGWWQLSAACLRVLLGPDRTGDLYHRAVAWVMQSFQNQNKKALGNIKDSMFQNMQNMRSLNPEREHGALDILEVGVGSGANLEFYPPGSSLTCVDPNPHVREYFRRECAGSASHLHEDVRFVVGEGEHLDGGGRFFYLEHVARAKGTVPRFVQDLLTNCGLWPGIMGCYLNRDPTEAVRAAGFRSVQQQYQLVFSGLRPWSLYHVANSVLSGVATK